MPLTRTGSVQSADEFQPGDPPIPATATSFRSPRPSTTRPVVTSEPTGSGAGQLGICLDPSSESAPKERVRRSVRNAEFVRTSARTFGAEQRGTARRCALRGEGGERWTGWERAPMTRLGQTGPVSAEPTPILVNRCQYDLIGLKE